ncbi:MAG: hypothetical protein ACTHU0_30740, partial [Kofleriaceae bacterium]
IAQELRAQAEPHKGAFRVEGPGARKLLEPIARHQANDGLLDILDLLGIEHGLHGVPSYNVGGKLAAFLGKLDEPTAALVATLYATIAGRSLKPTTARLEEEQAAELVAIAKRKVPWLGATKAKKSTSPKKAAAVPAAEPGELEDDDEEDGWMASGDDTEDLWDTEEDEELEEVES